MPFKGTLVHFSVKEYLHLKKSNAKSFFVKIRQISLLNQAVKALFPRQKL